MRLATGLMAMLAASAWTAEPAYRRTASMERQLYLGEIEGRAFEMYPRRRDEPMRDLNMTDGEVREVQVIAGKYQMPEIVNISPVVTGCPCEEGGSCTDQVYVTSRVGEHSVGLQLSRKKNLWTVGVVQKWWLEYAALNARRKSMTEREYWQSRETLLLSFPRCTKPAAEAAPQKTAEIKPAK